MRIDHVNIVVRDLEASVAFYRDTLGMTITMEARLQGDWIERVVGLKDVDADCVYLQPSGDANGPRVELLRYRAPEGLGLPNTVGLRHIAFRVDDLDAAMARLRQAGAPLFGDPIEAPLATVTHVAGRKKLVYFHDPEGNLLEYCEYQQEP